MSALGQKPTLARSAGMSAKCQKQTPLLGRERFEGLLRQSIIKTMSSQRRGEITISVFGGSISRSLRHKLSR